MLSRLTATEFVRAAKAGRTKPSIIACQASASERVEVVAKFSAGCDQGVTSLARELIAACLARDLGLPIPKPYLIDVTSEWVALIPDPERRAVISASSPVAFGSRHISGQYAAWNRGNRLTHAMLPVAAAVFAFDAITANPDRSADNPNCLVKGNEIRVIDHEMAFTHDLVIGGRPPWLPGGLKHLERPGSHIFREELRRRPVDLGPIRATWSALSNPSITDYGAALPAEWEGAAGAAQKAIVRIREARDNIDGCLTEIARVLECRTHDPTAIRS